MELIGAALAVIIGATLSASFGVAGGVITLAALSIFLSAKVAIPLHAVVILASNFFRIGIFFRHIHWPIVGLYAILLIPGVFIGSHFFGIFTENTLKTILGLLILYSIISLLPARCRKLPAWFPPLPSLPTSLRIISLGFTSGVLGTTIGATGPLVAGSFLKSGLVKEALIATKSASQLLLQLVKLYFFVYLLDFDFTPHHETLTILIICAGLGALMGKWLLSHISTELFRSLLTSILAITAIKLIFFS